MGCTASTPHSHTPTPTSTHGKSVVETTPTEDIDMILESPNTNDELQQTKLPPCDNVVTSVEIVEEMTSKTDIEEKQEESLPENIENIQNRVGCIADTNINEVERAVQADIDDHKTEDQLVSLEELVEKVVELYVADHDHQIDELAATTVNDDDPAASAATLPDNTSEESGDEIGKMEESPKCSESLSSRATRWEALADIAAELPPSLAVDPLTGQIYVLSK